MQFAGENFPYIDNHHLERLKITAIGWVKGLRCFICEERLIALKIPKRVIKSHSTLFYLIRTMLQVMDVQQVVATPQRAISWVLCLTAEVDTRTKIARSVFIFPFNS